MVLSVYLVFISVSSYLLADTELFFIHPISFYVNIVRFFSATTHRTAINACDGYALLGRLGAGNILFNS